MLDATKSVKKKPALNGCKLTAAFLEILKGTPNSGKGKGPTARSSNYKEKVLRNQEDKELARKYFKRGMEEMKEEAGLVILSIFFVGFSLSGIFVEMCFLSKHTFKVCVRFYLWCLRGPPRPGWYT